jgi:hypothetical protein
MSAPYPRAPNAALAGRPPHRAPPSGLRAFDRRFRDGIGQRTGSTNPLFAASLGFIGGALFWHFVGFWSFVSHAVFAPAEQQARAQTGASAIAGVRPSLNSDPIETGSLQRIERLTAKKIETECTAVARDPQTRLVQQAECPKLKIVFGINTAPDRQDRERLRSAPLPPTPVHEAAATTAVMTLDKSIPLDWPQRR